MSRLNLPNVTLAIVDTVNHELARMAVAACMAQAEFGETIGLSDKVLGTSMGIPVEAKTLDEAVWLYWYKVPKYVETSHMLFVQWDSWILNPEAWTDEFLEYDYVGAPWWYEDGKNVGNGGFSLRSTRLMRHVGANPEKYPFATAEDDQLCRVHREALEAEGFRWAPEDLAYRFSREVTGWERPDKSFGFHGLFTWPLHMTPAQIGERAQHFNDYILNGAAYKGMVNNQVVMMLGTMREHQTKGDVVEAAQIAKQLLRIDATTDIQRQARAEALVASANHQYSLQHYGTAIDFYHEAMRICPGVAEWHRALALIWRDIGWFQRSFIEAKVAATLAPNSAMTQITLGLLASEVGDAKIGRKAICGAIELEPDNTTAIMALAGHEADIANFDEAIRICKTVLQMNPNEDVVADINHTIGACYLRQGMPDEALEWIERPLNKDHPPQIWNRGVARLMKGDFERGWKDYEARFGTNPASKNIGNRFGRPMWDGTPGKRVHIHFEQGFGDMLQLVRLVPWVQRMGCNVSLEVQPELVELFQHSLPGINVVKAAFDHPGIAGIPWDFECHAPMMSLPSILGLRVGAIPTTPYLKPPKSRVRKWEPPTIGYPNPCKRVGFCWQGQTLLGGNLFMRTIDHWRSMQEDDIEPLREIDGVDPVSLQYGKPHEFENFADTAGLIANLDLVISVDTSVAHLAGAMGKPVWLLNRRDSCWRWGTEGEKSMWYPSMTIYRQVKRNGWGEVVQRVAADLREFVG